MLGISVKTQLGKEKREKKKMSIVQAIWFTEVTFFFWKEEVLLNAKNKLLEANRKVAILAMKIQDPHGKQ